MKKLVNTFTALSATDRYNFPMLSQSNRKHWRRKRASSKAGPLNKQDFGASAPESQRQQNLRFEGEIFSTSLRQLQAGGNKTSTGITHSTSIGFTTAAPPPRFGAAGSRRALSVQAFQDYGDSGVKTTATQDEHTSLHWCEPATWAALRRPPPLAPAPRSPDPTKSASSSARPSSRAS